jgi:hypothetical protein
MLAVGLPSLSTPQAIARNLQAIIAADRISTGDLHLPVTDIFSVDFT